MPRFETETDRQNERKVLDFLRGKYVNSVFGQFPKDYPIDFWIASKITGDINAIAELKVRNFEWNTYPTVYFSTMKYYHLFMHMTLLEVRAYFMVKLNDCLLRINILKINTKDSKLLGRFDRPEAFSDKEPIIEIPIDDFTIIDDQRKDSK